MLPIMPPHFLNNTRNGHQLDPSTTTTTSSTTGSSDRDSFFKIENILNRNINLEANRIIKNLEKHSEKLLNNSVVSVDKIKKDSVTCNVTVDDLIKNVNINRKIRVNVSKSDGFIRSISFKSDSSWIKSIQFAKDVHSNNVVIELIDENQIRLRAIKNIDENDELLLWFSEEISIMMNIPFLTPINIRGNNCYTCHNCKATYEFPNPLKIHLATSCSQHSIDVLWKNFADAIKRNTNSPPQPLLVQTNSIQPQLLQRTSQDLLTNTSLATTLLFSSHNHNNNHHLHHHHHRLLMKSQSELYQECERQSAFKPLTTPSPPASSSSSLLSPQISSSQLSQPHIPQRLPSSVSLNNHNIPSHSFLLHQHSACNNFQHLPISHHKLSPLHRTLFAYTSSPSSSFYSTTTSSRNALFTTSPASQSPSSSSSQHQHQHIRETRTSSISPASNHASSSAAAAAAAAALNAAAQIETIVSNMGASKQGHLCIYCGKLYSRKYGLKIHIRTHTGFKPLKCKYCYRPFGDPSNLNKHVRLHMQSGNLNFRCHLCNKTLARRRDLQRHIETRHCIAAIDDSRTTTTTTTSAAALMKS